MADLNPVELAEKALQVFSFVNGNKAFKNIRAELSEAFSNEVLLIWDKVKGWFIKKDPSISSILKKYEEDPDNADNKSDVKAELRRLGGEEANTLAQDLERIQMNYFEIVNKIGTIEGDENIIHQGGNKKTYNEVKSVKGSGNQIYQGGTFPNGASTTDPEK